MGSQGGDVGGGEAKAAALRAGRVGATKALLGQQAAALH